MSAPAEGLKFHPSSALAMQRWLLEHLHGQPRAQYIGWRLLHLTFPSEDGLQVRHPKLKNRKRRDRGPAPTMEELEEIIGQHEDTIRAGIEELVAAGVLRRGEWSGRQKTLTWVGDILDVRRKDTSENRSSTASATAIDQGRLVKLTPREAHEGAACELPAGASTYTRKLIVESWGSWRERTYALPAAEGRAPLSDDGWDALTRRFSWFATNWAKPGESDRDAQARIVDRGIEIWMRRRRGKDDFLVKLRHPLERLEQDLDWLSTEIAEDMRRARTARNQTGEPSAARSVPAERRADANLATGWRDVTRAAGGRR